MKKLNANFSKRQLSALRGQVLSQSQSTCLPGPGQSSGCTFLAPPILIHQCKCLASFATQASSDPSPTCQRLPIKRGRFATLSDKDVQHFERIVGKEHVLTEGDGVAPFNIDWMHWYKGSSRCVLLPRTTDEISAIVRHCYAQRLALVPQGGNTGLVGGSVPVFDEVVLSTKMCNEKFDFNSTSGILACGAGWVLESLDEKLAEHGYMMPIDLGAKGSCFIGGNVATGAGGLRLLRYGSIHSHLLGMKVVLADKDGSVLRCGSALRKDNTEFHQAQLFVGSEGLLGVITEVAMTAVPRPPAVNVAMLGALTFDDCCKILSLAKRILGEVLSSFELMDKETMRCLEENYKLANVLTEPGVQFNLLVETAG